jgi:hypothetical protein
MRTRTTRDLPVRLKTLRQRFERWRRARKGRSRIPEPLWAAAVKVAGTYGTGRTARALRVDYCALKKRVEGRHAVTASRTPEEGSGATFLEVPPPVWAGSGECTLELEDAAGAKLRVHLKGFGPPDLAALSRSFWQGQS